ncbi:MAG: hypothetical protein JWP11_2357 [Frankiales bacterium]|jgi:hypothetical protein|nr:hypothetical protein [Frankiales bacterium]
MALDLTDCPRCRQPLEAGFINAGKGPLRWNDDEPQTTIFGGELLVDRPWVWGRQRAEALRCLTCHLVMFEFDPDARGVAFTPTS